MELLEISGIFSGFFDFEDFRISAPVFTIVTLLSLI